MSNVFEESHVPAEYDGSAIDDSTALGPPTVLLLAAVYPFLIRDLALCIFAGGSVCFFLLTARIQAGADGCEVSPAQP